MAARIELIEMNQGGLDNWMGKTDPVERRRIQNRIHQRAWRARRKHEKQQQPNGHDGDDNDVIELPFRPLGDPYPYPRPYYGHNSHSAPGAHEGALVPARPPLPLPLPLPLPMPQRQQFQLYHHDHKQLQQLIGRQSPPGMAVTHVHNNPPPPPPHLHSHPQALPVGPPRPPRLPRQLPILPKNMPFRASTLFGQHRVFGDVTPADIERLFRLFLQRVEDDNNNTQRQQQQHQRTMAMAPDPMADQLIPLMQFNVFRGLLQNIDLLGIPLRHICADDAVSPLGCGAGAGASAGVSAGHSSLQLDQLPPGMRPTAVQLSTRHHPWLDFFPVPRMRDNLIRASVAAAAAGDSSSDEGDAALFDEDELCVDLVGYCDAPSEKPGIVVWGEPWRVESWEVTEEFVARWGWAVRGCVELMVSTNRWRAKRGERPLRWV